MASAPPLDIKVVYSSSRRYRLGGRILRGGGPTPRSRLLLLGLVNLLAASGLYYATWWLADPELRIKLIFHTPLPGVSPQMTAGVLVPPRPKLSPSRPPAAVGQAPGAVHSAKGVSTDALIFVGTVVAWEILATIAACALALSGGTLVGYPESGRWRRGVLILALLALAALGWAMLGLWTRYQRFTPDQLRYGVASLVVLIALIGLFIRRGARTLTFLAAIVLIISAAGSAVGLYIGKQYDAIKPEELPLPFLAFVTLVFVIHSLWGWILLPLASRVGHR